MSKPNVTVLMPVYNAALYLREAIESILSQTFTDFEFLIINDGSTRSKRDHY
jgi:glycosyltransferase involved in cell wall biosynthesis